jgi:hypothetical protein
MEANTDAALRGFVARILGWSPSRADAVEHAVRSIELAVEGRASLVLLGDADLVPIAYALHRRTLGAAPFVVCNQRRFNVDENVRSPANYTSGVIGFTAAKGGTLVLGYPRIPRDFPAVVALARNLNISVRLMFLGDARWDTHPFLVLPAPIRVPSLVTRREEIPRLVDEYARDAVAELRERERRRYKRRSPRRHKVAFTAEDRQWVIDNSPRTLAEIEKSTLRIAAIRMSPNLHRAADLLDIAPVSLRRWVGRRTLPPRKPSHELEDLYDDDDNFEPMSPEERAEFDQELEQSFVDEKAGRLIDAADAIADLRANPSDKHDH